MRSKVFSSGVTSLQCSLFLRKKQICWFSSSLTCTPDSVCRGNLVDLLHCRLHSAKANANGNTDGVDSGAWGELDVGTRFKICEQVWLYVFGFCLLINFCLRFKQSMDVPTMLECTSGYKWLYLLATWKAQVWAFDVGSCGCLIAACFPAYLQLSWLMLCNTPFNVSFSTL